MAALVDAGGSVSEHQRKILDSSGSGFTQW